MKLLKSVDVDTLMASFFTIYLDEISAVEKALQSTMEDDVEEDLLGFFTRMGSHFLPPKKGMKPAIEPVTHKVILQTLNL